MVTAARQKVDAVISKFELRGYEAKAVQKKPHTYLINGTKLMPTR